MNHEIMDNFALNVRARTKESFEHTLAIAFAAAPGGRASHWCEHPKFGLVLFWSSSEEKFQDRPIVPFPHELDAATATNFVWDWLSKIDRKKFQLNDWDRECNDGDVKDEKAWRAYVEDWGHVGNSRCAVVAVLPVWAWLGK